MTFIRKGDEFYFYRFFLSQLARFRSYYETFDFQGYLPTSEKWLTGPLIVMVLLTTDKYQLASKLASHG